MDTRADLRRQLRVLALADAFVYMCPAVYTTFLSAFYTRRGLTGTQTGILFGISPLMYILIQPLWARLADRSGRRREVLQIICVGSAAALLCFLSWQRICRLSSRGALAVGLCDRHGADLRFDHTDSGGAP